jgi:hypothetical protein
LEAVKLALLDIPAGLKPVSEDRSTHIIHQACWLPMPWHLHLATRAAAKQIAQDLAKNVPRVSVFGRGPRGPPVRECRSGRGRQ